MFKSVVIREVQIETTMSSYFTSRRMAILKIKKQKITSVDKNVEKLEPWALLVGMYNGEDVVKMI